MGILGLQKLTLLDYPGKVACTVFTAGCNFACPFCHNSPLLRGEGRPIPAEEALSFLKKRRGMLEGVCISGGEPTLWPGLMDFAREVKALGYAVKLDTNGARPEVLRALIDDGLIDYAAMDVKNSLAKYPKTAGTELDTGRITESISLLLRGSIGYEFRTTVTRELHTPEDMREIGRMIQGAEKYYIQPFKDSGDILRPGMSRHTDAELNALLQAAREYVKGAEIRG